MSLVFGIPILASLAAIQATLMTQFRVLGGAPDLILLAVIAWALVAPDPDGMLWALFGGLAIDLLSGGPFGMNAILLVIITYLAGFSEDRFWESHFLLPLAAVMVASLLYHGMTLGVLAALGRSVDWGLSLGYVTFPSVFFNLILTIPAYYAALRCKHFIYPPKVEF